MDRNLVQWNRAKLERFKEALILARANGRTKFEFEGFHYIPMFADLLIEYVDGELKRRRL